MPTGNKEQLIADGKCHYCQRPQDRIPGRKCSVCLKNHRKHNKTLSKRYESEGRCQHCGNELFDKTVKNCPACSLKVKLSRLFT